MFWGGLRLQGLGFRVVDLGFRVRVLGRFGSFVKAHVPCLSFEASAFQNLVGEVSA